MCSCRTWDVMWCSCGTHRLQREESETVAQQCKVTSLQRTTFQLETQKVTQIRFIEAAGRQAKDSSSSRHASTGKRAAGYKQLGRQRQQVRGKELPVINSWDANGSKYVIADQFPNSAPCAEVACWSLSKTGKRDKQHQQQKQQSRQKQQQKCALKSGGKGSQEVVAAAGTADCQWSPVTE